MGKTLRKSIDGIKFKEGQYDRKLNYRCRCYYCVGAEEGSLNKRNKTLNKRLLREEIQEYSSIG